MDVWMGFGIAPRRKFFVFCIKETYEEASTSTNERSKLRNCISTAVLNLRSKTFREDFLYWLAENDILGAEAKDICRQLAEGLVNKHKYYR